MTEKKNDTEATAVSGSRQERLVSRVDIARLRILAEAATGGEWMCGGTPCPSSDVAMEICRENIDATQDPNRYFFEVYLNDGRRTALVGNGPNGWANAEYIAAAGPETILALLDFIDKEISG